MRGLIQHGWTALSPVSTHFRDFPHLGLKDGDSRLLVWSHSSRAWDPAAERHHTTPIAAPFVYLAAASGALPQPRDHRDEVVLMPVHGIQTQRVRGTTPAWPGCGATRRARRPSACMPRMPRTRRSPAYRAAGHRLVVLGDRMDPAFLWRLWTMVGRARRVVSNRLSTPVVYAAHLGVDVGVYGDALRIDGEGVADNDRVRELWPRLHGATIDPATAKAISDAELGAAYQKPAQELEELLGWDPARRLRGQLLVDVAGAPGRRQPPPTRGVAVALAVRGRTVVAQLRRVVQGGDELPASAAPARDPPGWGDP